DNDFWNNQISFNEVLVPYWKNNNLFEFNIIPSELRKFVYEIEKEKSKIKDILTNGRGVEIGKKGRMIICPKCKNAQPPIHSKKRSKKCSNCPNTLDKHIIEEKIIFKTEKEVKNDVKYKKVFLGEHIHRFYSKNPFYIQIGTPGINYKNESIYSGPKILLAKTGHGINAFIDEQDNYTLQVVYIFKVRLEKLKTISEWSVLGILNSAIIHTYYYAKYGDINRKIFPHLIQSNILNLPFPKLNGSNDTFLKNIAIISEDLQKKYRIYMDLKNITLEFYEKITEKKEISLLSLLKINNINKESLKGLLDFLDKNIALRSNIDFNIIENKFLIIGYYFENKYIQLIRIPINSQSYLLLIYILLKKQKRIFKFKNKSTRIIFTEKIKVPKIRDQILSLFKKELIKTLQVKESNQISELLTIFSDIIFSELQLNNLILKSYEINDSSLLKSLIYPY
ncbi:MAG: TaqI-like C-terminal specificity domain-containing protein, partial [Candidatus Hodarchaeales archaeon]